jgi:hypothetical protein
MKFQVIVDFIAFRGKKYTKGEVITVDFDSLTSNEIRILASDCNEVNEPKMVKARVNSGPIKLIEPKVEEPKVEDKSDEEEGKEEPKEKKASKKASSNKAD